MNPYLGTMDIPSQYPQVNLGIWKLQMYKKGDFTRMKPSKIAFLTGISYVFC